MPRAQNGSGNSQTSRAIRATRGNSGRRRRLSHVGAAVGTRGEGIMRIVCSALLLAGAAWLAGSSGSIAAPVSGGAIKAAAEEIGIAESVHCRPFRHAHPRWHRFGHGCRGAGVIIYERGPRFRHRYGYGVREEFRTRERAGVTIRGGESFRGGTTFRSGTREGTSV